MLLPCARIIHLNCCVAVPPTPGPHGECPSSNWLDLDPSLPHCYFLEITEYGVSWDEANRNCAGLGFGSKLASVHSYEEMSKIHGELSKHNGLVAWIGLFTTPGAAADVYQWVDETPYDFFNWDENEPNSPGVELCVQAYGHNGKWNDAYCDQYYGTLGYVCKVEKVQPGTSPTPNTPLDTTSGGGGNTTPSGTTTSNGNSDDTTTKTPATTTTTSVNATPPNSGNKKATSLRISKKNK